MGYRSSIQVYVYSCPEEQRADVVRVLMDECDLDMQYADAEGDPLNLTAPYWAEETPLDTGMEVAEALREAAPGASFFLWMDPSDSDEGPILGDLHAYTPELGQFYAECDQHGLPRFTPAQIAGMIQRIRDTTLCMTSVTLAIELDKAMGKPWLDDWAAHKHTCGVEPGGVGYEAAAATCAACQAGAPG